MSKQIEEVMELVQEYASASESFPDYATMREVRESWTAIEAKLRELLPVWQPIETAPKDGTHVLTSSMGQPIVIHWAEHGTYSSWELTYGDDSTLWFEPTNWMPLPKAPE